MKHNIHLFGITHEEELDKLRDRLNKALDMLTQDGYCYSLNEEKVQEIYDVLIGKEEEFVMINTSIEIASSSLSKFLKDILNPTDFTVGHSEDALFVYLKEDFNIPRFHIYHGYDVEYKVTGEILPL